MIPLPSLPARFRLFALLFLFLPFLASAQLPVPSAPAPTPTPAATPEPVPAKIPLVLVGNEHLTEEEIRTALSEPLIAIAEEGALTPALADDAAFFLGLHYRKKGYSQVEVAWAIGPGNTLRLTIREGPFTRLGTVAFLGNETIPDGTLLEYFTGTKEQAATEGKKVIAYDQAEVESAIDHLRGLYAAEGYLDAIVDDAEVTISPDFTRADITVYIYEGIAYRFGKITFSGDLVFRPDSGLLAELEPITSKPYTPQAVIALERKVVYFYRTRGYFKVKVKTESDPALALDGQVPVHFTIDSGHLYHFDGVEQEGLQRLRPQFLENRFSDLKGKPYTPVVIDERYRKLMATGLFTTLHLQQEALPNDEVKLKFKVREAKAREVGFALGYGSLEGAIIGARYIDRNLFGYGRPLSINAEIAQNLLRGDILYTDPWFWNNDYTLRLRLYAMSQDFKDYSKLESGIHTQVSRKFGEHLEIAAFILARGVQINNTGNIDPNDLGSTSYFANSLGASFTLDYRNSALNPSQGWVITGSSDFAHSAFGSSISFFRTTGRISYYQPIGKTLLAVGLRAGLITGIGDGRLPIDERFFNGGSRSIRSYVERSMGPKDRFGHSIGGETFTTFNVENIFPIYQNLKGAVFFDAGTVGHTLGSGFGTTGIAVGAGLRYMLPIGPVRIDYGFNPVRKDYQPIGAFHFSLGFAF
ncbi:MAG TPA: outer membrane protein assembly factor BamA [Chthoniobacteraceae bacterium]|nr:outer membrane protein assembly factor BamA [Chthoniobacteraceae bacterium]